MKETTISLKKSLTIVDGDENFAKPEKKINKNRWQSIKQ